MCGVMVESQNLNPPVESLEKSVSEGKSSKRQSMQAVVVSE